MAKSLRTRRSTSFATPLSTAPPGLPRDHGYDPVTGRPLGESKRENGLCPGRGGRNFNLSNRGSPKKQAGNGFMKQLREGAERHDPGSLRVPTRLAGTGKTVEMVMAIARQTMNRSANPQRRSLDGGVPGGDQAPDRVAKNTAQPLWPLREGLRSLGVLRHTTQAGLRLSHRACNDTTTSKLVFDYVARARPRR